MKIDGARLWTAKSETWLGVNDANGLHATSLTDRGKIEIATFLIASLSVADQRKVLKVLNWGLDEDRRNAQRKKGQ